MKSVEMKRRKPPGSVKNSGQHSKMKEGTLQRMVFNGAPDYDKSLTNAGRVAKYRKPIVNQKYRITDGRYAGEMCKVESYIQEDTHVKVQLLDVWLKPTGKFDLVPCKYLRIGDEKRD